MPPTLGLGVGPRVAMCLAIFTAAPLVVARRRDSGGTPAPVVRTTSGRVSGLCYTSPARGGKACVYRAVPFAEPPTGERRLAPTVFPARRWEGVRDGSKPGPACFQTPEDDTTPQDEDCLHLTVWTGDVNASLGPRPVLVFFYGGGALEGANSWYNFSTFARDGAVVVAANYRLGPLGFLALDALSRTSATGAQHACEMHCCSGSSSHLLTRSAYRHSIPPINLIVASRHCCSSPHYQNVCTGNLFLLAQPFALTVGTSGNYGLMDCEAALHWTRENARAFQGDASQITIMGQSSGATMVWGLMSRLYPYPRPFERAIALSGGPNVSMPLEAAERQNEGIVESLGCHSEGSRSLSPTEVVSCLRHNVSAASLSFGHAPINTTWQEYDDLTWGIPHPAWRHGYPQPGIVVVDGAFLVQSFEASAAAGVNGDVDFLVSNMAEECDLSPNQDFTRNETDAPFRGTLVLTCSCLGDCLGSVRSHCHRLTAR